MLQQVVDLTSKPWLGSLLGVLGLVAAIFFYFRSRRRTRLAYQQDAVTVVGGSDATFPSELEIRFADEVVPRVTSDKIVLWNAGNTTIEGSQIVKSDPLRVDLPHGEAILKTSIVKVCREVNACRVVRGASEGASARIEFDFLDPGDGLAFEILHTANHDSLEFVGTLRGMPKGLSDFGRISWHSGRNFRQLPFPFSALGQRFPLYMALVFGIGMIGYGIFKPQLDDWEASRRPAKGEVEKTESGWPLIIGGIFYVGMPVTLLWMRRRRYPSPLDPEDKQQRHQGDERAEQDARDNGEGRSADIPQSSP